MHMLCDSSGDKIVNLSWMADQWNDFCAVHCVQAAASALGWINNREAVCFDVKTKVPCLAL